MYFLSDYIYRKYTGLVKKEFIAGGQVYPRLSGRSERVRAAPAVPPDPTLDHALREHAAEPVVELDDAPRAVPSHGRYGHADARGDAAYGVFH